MASFSAVMPMSFASSSRRRANFVANMVGFQITSIALSGEKQLTREEILGIAGITGRSSLLFLNADDAPQPAEGQSVDRRTPPSSSCFRIGSHISVTERRAFALWQKDGRVQVVSA